MKLIVESGATKTAWRSLASDGTVREALTSGLNPTCLDEEICRDIIRSAIPALNPAEIFIKKLLALPIRNFVRIYADSLQ